MGKAASMSAVEDAMTDWDGQGWGAHPDEVEDATGWQPAPDDDEDEGDPDRWYRDHPND